MHFWFVHSGEVSIREQIVTQITLGVLSGELAPGERLPSTRELARRFHLHANTVSTAYQQLESDGWVESRRGSGVFVRGQRPVAPLTSHSPSQALNHIFSRFLNSARKLDIPDTQVKDLLRRWLETPTTTRFLFIEPREPLRELKDLLVGAIPLALPSKAATVRSLLPAGTELITLQVRSAASSLAENLPVPSDALIGVASRWPEFLEMARVMLIAAGFAPEALLFCDTAMNGWQDRIHAAAGVVCDVFTAARLPATVRVVTFPVLADAAIEDLRHRARAIAPCPPSTLL
jgi:GntR family transcriptional regulator